MDNIVIDTPKRLDEDIEDFKIDAVDDEKNFTVSRVKLCRDPKDEKPILFYTQELSRNFKNPRDPFGKRHIIKAFTPSNFEAVADTTLEKKFTDTILAHKNAIDDYSPLTDIHSQKMNLFLDEDTAVFLDDVGINVDGMGEDFQSIESVSASPFMEEIAFDAAKLKRELFEFRRDLIVVKQQMADEFKEYLDPTVTTEDEFTEALARENVSTVLVKSYLSIKEKIKGLESQLGEVSNTVFKETAAKIKLPGKENIDELFTI
jgi:hypothetical protein